MNIVLENIGLLDRANLDLNGITVVAGYNNVGKSTIGKALFAFLTGMSGWEDTYAASCRAAIRACLYNQSVPLEDMCMQHSGARRRRTGKTNQLIERYAADEDFRVTLEDCQIEGASSSDALIASLKSYCLDYLSLYFKNDGDSLKTDYGAYIESWSLRAAGQLTHLVLDEVVLQKEHIRTVLQGVFNGQYRKIGTDSSRIVFTDDDNRTVTFSVTAASSSLDRPIRTLNNIYFIESPHIYDYISNAKFGDSQRYYLRRMMIPNTFRSPINAGAKLRPDTVMDEPAPLPVSDITGRLADVMGGQAEFLQKVGLEFKDRRMKETIHSDNVSTGLKSLALLEYALRIGAIVRGDILILDEPEINLHPEWQMEYAKAIVGLQRTFGLRFVITSHSPFFLRAIECYTDAAGTMDCLNVYRVSLDGESRRVQVENVSYSEYGMSALYEDLAEPLDKLQATLAAASQTDSRDE